MIGAWRKTLEQRGPEWGLPVQGRWTCLFNNNYHPHYTNFNLLWFHDNSRFPRVVTKVFREPDLPNREFANLERAYARASEWTPRPLALDERNGFWNLWMEGAPGVPYRAGHRYDSRGLLSMVDMLAELHAALQRDAAAADAGRHRRCVIDPLKTVSQFGISAAVRRGCSELADAGSAAWIESLPVMPQHGDVFVSNVLRNGDHWSILDWETYGFIDLPYYDLFTLLFSLLDVRRKASEQWDSALVDQAPALITRYARRLNLNVADATLMLPLTLANWFHLLWREGRREFATRMYPALEHYFEHRNLWERILPRI